MIRARLIGGFSLTSSDGRDLTPRSRKAAAIVAYLLLSGAPAARRERLASLLWSEKSESQARDSLRQCLLELRRAVLADATADAALVITIREVRIAPDCVATDVADIARALEAGDLLGAARHLDGVDPVLLASMEGPDELFASWLSIERERWSQAVVAQMLQLLRTGDLKSRDVVALSETILRMDPYQEQAVAIAMDALANAGIGTAAVAFFERYERRLRAEYGLEPPASLRRLSERIRQQASRHPMPETLPAMPARTLALSVPRIGVGVGNSTGAGLDGVTDAFRHDLLTTLSRFKEWTIISLSTPHDGSSTPSTGAIDYALGADLASAGDGVAVRVTLDFGSRREELLSFEFSLRQGRWISVLNDICCQLAARLQIAISSPRLRRASGTTAAEKSAYEFWLEGNQLTSTWQADDEERAYSCFETAIELDPALAPAYSGLAAILHTRHIVRPGWQRTQADRERALAFARRAVELDRMDCRNHVVLGWAHLLAGNYDNAEFHFLLAVDLNPSNPNVAMSAAAAANLTGDHDGSARLAATAFRLNPWPPAWYFAYRSPIAFFAGDLAGAIADAAAASAVFPFMDVWQALALAAQGEVAPGSRCLKHCFTRLRSAWSSPVAPNDDDLRGYLFEVYPFRRAEDRSRVLALLDRLSPD